MESNDTFGRDDFSELLLQKGHMEHVPPAWTESKVERVVLKKIRELSLEGR